MRRCSRVMGALIGLCVALWAAPASAHPREAGILQARWTDDGIELLLKLDSHMLFDAVALGSPEDFDPLRLTEPTGRGRVMHLIAERVRVEAATGLCDRDSVDLFALTPSQRHLDVLMRYHCAEPRRFVAIHATILLDDTGHYLTSTFADAAGTITRRRLKRSAPDWRFEAPPTPPVAAPEPAPAPRTPAVPVGAVPPRSPLWGLMMAVLLVAILGGRARSTPRLGLAAVSVAGAGVGASLALGLPVVAGALAGPLGEAGHLVVAGSLVAAGVRFSLRDEEPGPLSAALWFPATVVVGLVLGEAGASSHAFWWVLGASSALVVPLCVLTGPSARGRKLAAVVAMAVGVAIALEAVSSLWGA